MAAGDAAAAAGFPVVAPTDDLKDGWEEINNTRDLLAAERARVQPVAQGGTGATSAAQARANLDVKAWNTPSNGNNGDQSGRGNVQADLEDLSKRVNTAQSGANNAYNRGNEGVERGERALRGEIYADSYNRNVSGSGVRVAYLGSGGNLGYSPSSARYKEDVEAHDVTDEQLAGLSLVAFRYKNAPPDAPREVGFIAEQVAALGLEWLIFRDDAGRVEGVHWERVALALLPSTQRLLTRVEALEKRLGEGA